ncbi:MAG: hypothetical protein ACOC32_03945 [Nanoarchaeota archaeon]
MQRQNKKTKDPDELLDDEISSIQKMYDMNGDAEPDDKAPEERSEE